MNEIKTYKTNDLVLTIAKDYNPIELELTTWDRYLDVLCVNREYQKEAIRNAIIYLSSGKYQSISDLIYENYKNNSNIEIRERYNTYEDYIEHLQIPNKLSATIDLATGTGKSYVMFGIAQIMLSLGKIDRVLVLCPSLTIEKELTKKFVELSGDDKLKNTIPEGVRYKNPRIIDGNNTIKEGDICIENIHAVYENNSSSIYDSLAGKGKRVLVLNDEAHHIFNKINERSKESNSIKKWKEFLMNPDFKFKYIIGLTGTAYIEDEYFNDVIYRYSLRQAVDERIVKMIDYVSRDDSINTNEKLQKIYDNHIENKTKYNKIKPLTIMIAKNISNAKRLTSKMKEFLINKEGLSDDEADKKVLTVTSHNEHKSNVLKLSNVDNIYDPTEWIVSVSMLTEGWDVKNVFQIVPWEDRAFNSKLLIAQVLGRGLRIPKEYQSPQPKVRVFNHSSWSKNIRRLVDEILEIEMKLRSSVLIDKLRSKYNFALYNINYDRVQKEKDARQENKEFDYTKGYINLIAQVEKSEKETEYISLSGRNTSKNTLVTYNTYTVEEVVDKIIDELETREWEGKILKLPEASYTRQNLPEKEEIENIIRNSMKRVGIHGDRLVEKNRHKILTMFSTLLRKKHKTVVNIRKVQDPVQIETCDISRESMSVGNLRHNATVFYSKDFYNELNKEMTDILVQIIEDESLPKSSSKEVNSYLFKTPVDIVFTKGEPERTFIQILIKNENASQIEGWIKSRDYGFYSIEYSFTTIGGRHSNIHSFNPDFFIKIVKEEYEYYVVTEIKQDNDVTLENKAKLKYAKKHFKDLNRELKSRGINQKYIFHFISPNSYTEFFEYLRNGTLLDGAFRSDLEDKLEN